MGTLYLGVIPLATERNLRWHIQAKFRKTPNMPGLLAKDMAKDTCNVADTRTHGVKWSPSQSVMDSGWLVGM